MSFKKGGVEFRLEGEDFYHYEAFKGGNVSSSEMRAEYSRLRQTANKRLKRMEGTKYERSQTYLRNMGKYMTIEEISAAAGEVADRMNIKGEARQKLIDSHIAHKLSDIYKFLTAKTGSIRGMQRVENELIETLHDRGLTFVNKDNIHKFGEYMEHLRSVHKGRIYDSERAADLFGIATKKGIDPQEIAEDYEYWKQHTDELSQLPKIRNAKKRSAADYKKLLERK